MRPLHRGLVGFLVVLVGGGLLFSLPPVRTRAYNLMEDARVRVRAAIFPQNEVAFIPGGRVQPTVTPPAEELTPSPSPSSSPTPVPSPSLTPLTPQPTATPRPSPTALPASVALRGVRWETQNGAWNYCGPTNLAMLLSYWGWQGDKFTTGKYLKPFDYDLNVMPYEMENYVEEKTELKMKVRYGGTMELLRKLLAAGFPVLTEVGVYFPEVASGSTSWMGHYRTLTGYDDARKALIVQDSYIRADYTLGYDAFLDDWRAFDYVFLVAYPADKEELLSQLLGSFDDVTQSYQIALKTASDEIFKMGGMAQYFAWFNRGTSLVLLKDYPAAAEAYDKAFALYAKLPEDRRPWRMLWHQTGPYYAYFLSGRYQDTLDLATSTLDFIQKRAERLGIGDRPQVGPFIEETWVWRARARIVLGDQKGAAADLKMALKYHPGFAPALDELSRLGVAP